MRFINYVIIIQVICEKGIYILAQDDTVSLDHSLPCKSDRICNVYSKALRSFTFCSVCVEENSGKAFCMENFYNGQWFNKQCAIGKSCDYKCRLGGVCVNQENQFTQSCLCNKDSVGQQCESAKEESETGYQAILWERDNVMVKPGVLNKLFFRAVGDQKTMDEGVYKMFKTDFGFIENLGEDGKKGKSSPWRCEQYKGLLCVDDYTELRFPFIPHKNDYGVTVLKLGNTELGYLTHINAKFRVGENVVVYDYETFVNYQTSHLNCIAVIHFQNCASTIEKSSSSTFYLNEPIDIKNTVEYLANGNFRLSSENLQICTDTEPTWTWTWSKWEKTNFFGEDTSREVKKLGNTIGPFLSFDPFELEIGVYRIILSIKRVLTGGSNENFAQCFFEVGALPLKAIIDGGEVRTVIKEAGITLTAKRSYDPNVPPNRQGKLRLLWSCECLTKTISNCESTCKYIKQNPLWLSGVDKEFYVYPHQIQYNAEYKFTLTVDTEDVYPKGIAVQKTSVIIKVADKSVKVVTNYYIDCIQNCDKEKTMSNEILFLKAKILVSGGSSQTVNKTEDFSWVYAQNNGSVFKTLDPIKMQGLPTNVLAVKENSFEQGVIYTINLKDKDGNAISTYSFKTQSVKYPGNCSINPTSGIKGLSTFDIICEGFEGYIFEFYDKSEEDLNEKVGFNGRMLGTSEFLGSLKNIRVTRGTIVIYIIKKESGLFQTKQLKVELSPWNITDEIWKEIINNLTATVKLGVLSTTMNYVSFIPDVLPPWVDKGQILDLLLGPISQATLITVGDVKLSASTMKIVLQTLNKPIPLSVNLPLIGRTLALIEEQADIIRNAVFNRETEQWMPSAEIRLVAIALLDCLNAALICQRKSTESLSEEKMKFDALFTLINNAQETADTIDQIKDIASYIQSAGLPPAKIESSDKTFQVWALGYDGEYPLSDMLKSDINIPFSASQHFLRTYSQEEEFGSDLFFQAALIQRNMFPWSKSDVRSNLVSFSVAQRKKGEDLKKINFLSSPIHVRLNSEKNITKNTVKGSALQLDPHLNMLDLDLGFAVHRIDNPPKGFITIHFLFPQTQEPLRVLVMEDFRPDYELMNSPAAVVIDSSNPEYPLKHRSVDLPLFLYMGILPAKNVSINRTVNYEFEVTTTLCQLWIQSQWSSIGCTVSVRSTYNKTVCECTHLSIFAAAFPVPPQSIDPFADAKLFLTVLENPLVVTFVIILFIIYLLLVLWGRYKDNVDQYKGKVVVLDDNFPEDTFPYIVAVHTSTRFNAGTTAHVGFKLLGKEASSRAHILSSERRKVLKRNCDDWFMIYTPKSLGNIYGIHVWHDNYGSRPEWYCDKIVVYDLSNSTESVFIVEQWLALRQGDYPEANLLIATDQDMLNIKRMFLDNSILGFRDSHTFLSVFVRHPRSEVTRVQRVSILMCCIMVAMLCSIMFFVPDNEDNPTDDFQYDLGLREIIISVQTLIITGVLTLSVLISFKRSYKVFRGERATIRQYRRDEFTSSQEYRLLGAQYQDKTLYENYVRYVSKYLKNPPLAPVSMWEGEKRVQRRLIWFIIAWSFCIVIILVAAYFVMLYGLKLGFIQSQKWLTSLVMAMGEDIFVMGPGRIIFIAILLSMAFQMSTKVDLHGISLKDAMLARPKNELNYLNILLAKRSHPMYAPLSSSARLALLKKKDIRGKWWNLIDFLNSVCYIIVISSVIDRLWTSHFHSDNHLNYMFAKSENKQFGSTDIDKIRNISMVENYLEVTFLQDMFNLWWYNDGVMTNGQTEPGGIFKYWGKDYQHKMITKPIVTQNRVVPYECQSEYFKPMKCLLKWSLSNKDTNVYSEKWAPATYLDVNKKDSPWEYKDIRESFWWTNERFYGKRGNLYDVGGYSTSIGPTLKEAQKILAELRENSWQDWFTRACFLTVTLYNVNTQLISQVTMHFEYFVDGSMSSSSTVMAVSREQLTGGWELLFLLYAIYYVGRSGYLINRLGLMEYLSSKNNVFRVVNVFLAFLVMILFCIHHSTSSKYSQQYFKGQLGDYFDFDKFVNTFTFVQIVLSLLLCFAIARSFMLLRGGRRFLNVYYALIISTTFLLWLAMILILLIFVCSRLQYFFHCQEYFRMKELILPQKMTKFLITPLLEHGNVQVFVLLRGVAMWFVAALFIVSLLHYIRVARVYKLRESDSFNLVLFFIDRLKMCCGFGKKSF